MGQRSLCGSYGSRQGSPLPSHRSSRDSGDDLWADRPLDLDPARVSHIPVSQSVRHPSGVAGSITISDPRVVGATPLRPVARKLAPQGVPPRRLAHCLIGQGDALSDMSDKSDGADGAVPMERAPFGCLTDKPSRYMITPMLMCFTPSRNLLCSQKLARNW